MEPLEPRLLLRQAVLDEANLTGESMPVHKVKRSALL